MAMVSGIMPGPSSRENGGCASISGAGLLAYGAASSVVVIDVRSMQLVTVLAMPLPKSSALAPFVTALEWLPEGLSPPLLEFEQPHQQLQLAAGDRHGRIVIWDVATGSPIAILAGGTGGGSVAQVCWLHSSSWLLAAIHGASVVVVWDTKSASAIWKYDAAAFGEVLGCLRCDPHDRHQFCVLGSKGLLLSVIVGGNAESDILTKVYHVAASSGGASSGGGGGSDERDRSSSSSTSSTNGGAALAPAVRCLFSSASKGILYVMFPREIFVFDLQFGMTLSSSGIPRGCGKLLDLIADLDGQLLFCAHLDGKISAWKRKDDSQVFAIVHIDSLMPSVGTTVPTPSMLAATLCPINLCVHSYQSQQEDAPMSLERIVFVSLSDDGRLWHWLLQCENTMKTDMSFQLELTGQLHLLPSSVTTMAVPVPSLLATFSGGGNAAAVPVQLVALATQAGTIELFDPAANAVTSSLSVHGSSVVRAVRWLGNSRLVSFSYAEVKGKGGGFVNKIAVTCVRSGQSKYFRVLQKPERAPMRALRTSPSGRYMLILFREAPAEVWAMTKNPQMLRSLALPFTVMEWALPAAPKKTETSSKHRPSLAYRERPTIASTVAAANAPATASEQDTSQDDTGESFAFALVNGSLGVFELRGRRVRDFKPKWPISSFVSPDVLVTAMAYRMPHVVMGDRLGNLRWWDITSGASSWFNAHRGGIRRIKFAPVLPGDSVRGRVAILFNDNTFAVYDLDTQDPLASSFVQPHLAGILVLELDWFPFRPTSQVPLLLCVVAADSSFRVLEIQSNSRGSKSGVAAISERQRPAPVYSPALLPLPQALALRMLLQLGVRSSWFIEKSENGPASSGDLRHHLLETHLPAIGDPVVLELLLKALEPYRKAGRLLDAQTIQAYSVISNQGSAARLAFAAAHFGNDAEAAFWLQLPPALLLLSREAAGTAVSGKQQTDYAQANEKESESSDDGRDKLASLEKASSDLETQPSLGVLSGDRAAVRAASQERILWHKNLGGDEAVQKLIHEHITVGDFEAAVTLLLGTPPENSHFYVDALRAVSLAAAVSPGLHELAVKVVAANLVATDDSLAGTHLLCAVGRFQEACSQLQDAGRWEDASTLAASKLKGVEMARVLQRWAEHVLQSEHNLWKAVTLYVAAGALSDALAALNARHPDIAAMFLLACHEAKAQSSRAPDEDVHTDDVLDLPGDLRSQSQEVRTICELYGHHQRWLAQLCSESTIA